MTQRCEKEEQTSAAIRSGTVSPEIAEHAQHCPVCSEVMLVAEFLQTNADLAEVERVTLPTPALIWQRAQRQATERAVRRALRPIRFMKFMACIAFVCSPWLRWLPPIEKDLAASWSKAFDLNFAFLSKPLLAAATEATLVLGISGTIVLLVLSSWYMLRQE